MFTVIYAGLRALPLKAPPLRLTIKHAEKRLCYPPTLRYKRKSLFCHQIPNSSLSLEKNEKESNTSFQSALRNIW